MKSADQKSSTENQCQCELCLLRPNIGLEYQYELVIKRLYLVSGFWLNLATARTVGPMTVTRPRPAQRRYTVWLP